MSYRFLILASLLWSAVRAQELIDFDVTKTISVPFEHKFISLEVSRQDQFLLICAADLAQFTSEKRAKSAAKEVGGFMLRLDEAELKVYQYSNLFAYGPGFVYFNRLENSLDHTQEVWAQVPLLQPRKVLINDKQFLIEAGNLVINVNDVSNGAASTSFRHGKMRPVAPRKFYAFPYTKYDFQCYWKAGLKIDI